MTIRTLGKDDQCHPKLFTKPAGERKVVYLEIKLLVEDSVDVQRMVNELDYNLTYEGILFTELIGFTDRPDSYTSLPHTKEVK